MYRKLFLRPYFLISALVLLVFQGFAAAAQNGIRTIVLDAGHGGQDPGNLGTRRYKTSEKDISLEVILKLGTYIHEEFPDIKIIYTRKDDRFIELNERAAIANRNNADLFISVHCNYAEAAAASGTETFVMGLHRSKENLNVAMRENSVILQENNYENTYADFNPRDPDSYIAMSLMQGAYRDQSLTLASKVQEEFVRTVGRKNRGVKEAGLLVLYKSAMPAILIELGFLTNPAEEDFLQSDDGKVYMASSIYRAFKVYKSSVEAINEQSSKEQKPKDRPGKEKKVPVYAPEPTPDSAAANEIVPVEIAADAVVFKVQLVSSDQKLSLTSARFKGEQHIEQKKINGVYKYTTGSYNNYEGARDLLNALKKKFPEAFIVAFKNDLPIPVKEAIKLTEANKSENNKRN